MCIIAICKSRKLTKEEILNCWRFNEDGAGIATTDNNDVVAVKGLMDPFRFLKVYKSIPEEKPHVVHFRTASCGYIMRDLTHPFIISQDSPSFTTYTGKKPVFFHNGHFEEWKSVALHLALKKGKMAAGELSDTRVLAMLISSLGTKALSIFNDKYVVVYPSGKIKYWGKFEKEDGVLFSNKGYTGVMSFGKKQYHGNMKINF